MINLKQVNVEKEGNEHNSPNFNCQSWKSCFSRLGTRIFIVARTCRPGLAYPSPVSRYGSKTGDQKSGKMRHVTTNTSIRRMATRRTTTTMSLTKMMWQRINRFSGLSFRKFIQNFFFIRIFLFIFFFNLIF